MTYQLEIYFTTGQNLVLEVKDYVANLLVGEFKETGTFCLSNKVIQDVTGRNVMVSWTHVISLALTEIKE